MLQDVIALTRAAGAIVLKHYDAAAYSPVEITRKADDSPLTIADREANDCILAGLRRIAPEVPAISEEAANAAYEDRRAWTRFWLVDPLDGTKEFIKRNGEFTVNIALIEDGAPVLGVVYAPALDTLYYAARGQGAFKVVGLGEPQQIHSRPPASDAPLRVVTSRSHVSNDAEALLPGRVVGKTVPTGSSLKFCLVAEGRADVYPRKGPTMEWDVAAGDCVYRNSGLQGERASPLQYNKPDLLNSGFVIGIEA